MRNNVIYPDDYTESISAEKIITLKNNHQLWINQFINGFSYIQHFLSLNNEKNIISTIFLIFFNWRKIYGNFIWYVAYLLTTPDILHWLGSRHRLFAVLFRRVRTKSSTLNRFCWHYTFENNEWLRLNNCLDRLSWSILNIFPIIYLFGLPFRAYYGNMPMDIVTGCPSYWERQKIEWRNNRWNGSRDNLFCINIPVGRQ